MSELQQTPISRIRRHPERGCYDREAAYAILDEALVAHVAFVVEGRPFVIPMVFARVDDALYIHGAVASRLMRTLQTGVPVCVTVTLIDGLVLARSAFHHSMNYRSVMLFGDATLVPHDDKARVFDAFVDKVEPGRSAQVRGASPQETTATVLLRVPIDEASVKRRSGPPVEAAHEPAREVWTGVVPLALVPGVREPTP